MQTHGDKLKQTKSEPFIQAVIVKNKGKTTHRRKLKILTNRNLNWDPTLGDRTTEAGRHFDNQQGETETVQTAIRRSGNTWGKNTQQN